MLPPVREVWIEIFGGVDMFEAYGVTSRTGGVD